MSKPNNIPRFGDIAEKLIANGYPIVPIKYGEKAPSPARDWQQYEFQRKHVSGKFAPHKNDGTGILCGAISAIDIDVRHHAAVKEIEALAETMLGSAPRRVGAAPKVLRVYRTDKPFTKITSDQFVMPDDDTTAAGYKPHRIEVLGVGQQFVSYNEHPGTHKPYKWNGAGDPLTVKVSDLADVNQDKCNEFIIAAEGILLKHGGTSFGKRRDGDPKLADPLPTNLNTQLKADAEQAADVRGGNKLEAENPEKCLSALRSLPNNDVDYDTHIKIGYAIAGAFGKDGEGHWHDWAAKSEKYVEKNTQEFWRGFVKQLANDDVRSGAGTIIELAKQNGWSWPTKAPPPDDTPPNDKQPPRTKLPFKKPLTNKLPFDYRDVMRTFDDLLANPPPPTQFILRGLLALGACSLLIGKPKSFKSTLAAQMAFAMSGHPEFVADWKEFGLASKKHHRVGIIDLEQSERNVYEMVERFDVKHANNLVRLNDFPKLDADGIGHLEQFIRGEKLNMVIIDSWTRVQPTGASKNGVFSQEGEAMQRITNLAHAHKSCHITVIAHGGKRDASDDPMQMIAGTNALPASVDDVMVLFKKGEEDDDGRTNRRYLFVSGRNIAKHGTHILEKERTASTFTLIGDETSTVRGEAKRRILGILGGGAAHTSSELAKALNRNRGQVHHALMALVDEKLVVAVGGGKYQRTSAAASAKLAERRKEPK